MHSCSFQTISHPDTVRSALEAIANELMVDLDFGQPSEA